MSGQCRETKRGHQCRLIGRHVWHRHEALGYEWNGSMIRYYAR